MIFFQEKKKEYIGFENKKEQKTLFNPFELQHTTFKYNMKITNTKKNIGKCLQ